MVPGATIPIRNRRGKAQAQKCKIHAWEMPSLQLGWSCGGVGGDLRGACFISIPSGISWGKQGGGSTELYCNTQAEGGLEAD